MRRGSEDQRGRRPREAGCRLDPTHTQNHAPRIEFKTQAKEHGKIFKLERQEKLLRREEIYFMGKDKESLSNTLNAVVGQQVRHEGCPGSSWKCWIARATRKS
jgi:hypothetical protein